MVVNHSVVINKHTIARDSVLLMQDVHLQPEDLYRNLGCNYPKFFKMDILCKWAWLGAEYLFSGNDDLYKGLDKNKIAVMLATSRGCIDVDKRYYDSIAMPSPSLFVYTLPNIMLGEISIRHGFKGEQLCMVNEQPDFDEMYFNINEFLNHKGMDACLCGWADAAEGQYDVCLFWITKSGSGIECTPGVMQELYTHKHYKLLP